MHKFNHSFRDHIQLKKIHLADINVSLKIMQDIPCLSKVK